jgi:serine phosphatase RsbU (regulator of sigma subunit)
VLVSDGVVESRRASGEQFGTHRLKQALDRYAGLPRSAAVERIVEDVCAFAEQRPADDDVTLVMVGRG